jgi:uncharacterized protein (DUF2249 family)
MIMDITTNTNINKLLKAYPQLEEFLMSLNPKYKKLKNPILRKTVANIATLKQVAMIGGYEPIELVNILRAEVGLEPLSDNSKIEVENRAEVEPEWIKSNPKVIVDANSLLDEEKNPLSEVSKELKKLSNGEILMIKSDFLPQPLIEKFKEEGFELYSKKINDNEFETFIKK